MGRQMNRIHPQTGDAFEYQHGQDWEAIGPGGAGTSDGGQVPPLISVDEVRRMTWKSRRRHSVRLTSVLDLLLAQHRPQLRVLPASRSTRRNPAI